MTQIVIMPGGFHPFHAGHYALYQSAQRAFPRAEVFVAATNDTSTRPFPFPVKEKLAKLAGVEPGHFVQVKSPFRAEEITSRFDPAKDVLIFVRSEKDADKPPQAGGVKRDGSPSYLQPLQGQTRYEPFSKHAYMAYLPTVEFGPGMTSATEIRTAWPQLNEKRKTALVMSLYPRTQGNAKLAATVVGLLDAAIGTQGVAEGSIGDKIKGAAKSVKRATQGWGVGAAPDMITPKGVVQAFGDMDGQRLANFVASRKDFSKPGKDSARAFADKVIDREMKQRGYGRVADKDEQGVAEGAPIVVAQAPIDVRNSKKAPQPYRNQGDIVPPTKPPSTEKRGVKGRAGQRPMPKYDKGMAESQKQQSLYWTDLPESIGLDEKCRIIEEYYTNNNSLFESVSEVDKTYFLDLDKYSVEPKKGNEYIAVLLALVGNKITQLSPVDTVTVVGVKNNQYFLQKQDGTQVTYPSDQLTDRMIYKTFLFDNSGSYDTFRSAVMLKFNTELPKALDENQGWAATLEEKRQGNLDADPELKQAKQFAVQHYPEFANDPDMAFDKWVQRSLEHGQEDDQKQFKMLQGVAEKVKRLEQAIAQARVQQSAVQESDYIEEKWSQKYKSSINCANPKGFSQKAHCAGRKK